jgi:hypothetical protein
MPLPPGSFSDSELDEKKIPAWAAPQTPQTAEHAQLYAGNIFGQTGAEAQLRGVRITERV